MRAKLENYFETRKAQEWEKLNELDRAKALDYAVRFASDVSVSEMYIIKTLEAIEAVAGEMDGKVLNKRYLSKISDKVSEMWEGASVGSIWSMDRDKYSLFDNIALYLQPGAKRVEIYGFGRKWITEEGRIDGAKLKERAAEMKEDQREFCKARREATANLPAAFVFRNEQRARLEDMKKMFGRSLHKVLDHTLAI